VPPRVIGLYSLALMEKEGPVYGYLVSKRIADRTGGSWQPGAGAVYPALATLVERGLAERTGRGRRREFRITPRGKTFLRRLRSQWSPEAPRGPDLSVLWSDIAGRGDVGAHLLGRLRRTVDGLESYLGRTDASDAELRALRGQVLAELRLAQQRVGGRPRRGVVR